jgi:hypothetical protein
MGIPRLIFSAFSRKEKGGADDGERSATDNGPLFSINIFHIFRRRLKAGLQTNAGGPSGRKGWLFSGASLNLTMFEKIALSGAPLISGRQRS